MIIINFYMRSTHRKSILLYMSTVCPISFNLLGEKNGPKNMKSVRQHPL